MENWRRTEDGQEELGQAKEKVQSQKKHSIIAERKIRMRYVRHSIVKMKREQHVTGKSGKRSWRGILEVNDRMKA